MPLLDKNGLPIKSRIDKTGSPFKAAFEAGISSAKATIVVDPRDVTYLYVEDTSAPKLILRGPYCASCMTVRYRRGNLLGDLVLFIQSGDILEESQLGDLLLKNGSLNPFPSRVASDKTPVQQQCFDTACQFRKSQAICRKTDSTSQTEKRFSESANNIEDAEQNSAFTARSTNRNSDEPLLHGTDSRFSIPISDDDMTSRLMRIEMNMSMLSPFGDRVILKEELNRRRWMANNCTYCSGSGWDDCYISHVTSEKHLEQIKKAGRFVTMAEFTALDTAVLTALKRARKLPFTEELKNVAFLFGARDPGVPLEHSKLVEVLENLRSDFAVYDSDVIEQNFPLYFKKAPNCNYCRVALDAANTISHVLSAGHIEKVLSQGMCFTPYDNSTMYKFLTGIRKMERYHQNQERMTNYKLNGRRTNEQEDDDFVIRSQQTQNNFSPKTSASDVPIPFFGVPISSVDDPLDFSDPDILSLRIRTTANLPAVLEELRTLGFNYPIPFTHADCFLCSPREDNSASYHYLTNVHRKNVQAKGMCFSKRNDLDALKLAVDRAILKIVQAAERDKECTVGHIKKKIGDMLDQDGDIDQPKDVEHLVTETSTTVEKQHETTTDPNNPSTIISAYEFPIPFFGSSKSIVDDPADFKDPELLVFRNLIRGNLQPVVEELRTMGFNYPIPFTYKDCSICPPKGENLGNYHFLNNLHMKQVQERGLCFSKRHDFGVLRKAILNAAQKTQLSKNEERQQENKAQLAEENMDDNVEDVAVAELQKHIEDEEMFKNDEYVYTFDKPAEPISITPENEVENDLPKKDESIIAETPSTVEPQNENIFVPVDQSKNDNLDAPVPTTSLEVKQEKEIIPTEVPSKTSLPEKSEQPKPAKTNKKISEEQPTPTAKLLEDGHHHWLIPTSPSSSTCRSLLENCSQHHLCCPKTAILDDMTLTARCGRVGGFFDNFNVYCSSAGHLASRCIAVCPLCTVRCRCVCEYINHIFSMGHLMMIIQRRIVVCESDLQMWVTAIDHIICSSEVFMPDWHISKCWPGDPRWAVTLKTSDNDGCVKAADRQQSRYNANIMHVPPCPITTVGRMPCLMETAADPNNETPLYTVAFLRSEYRRIQALLPPFETFCEHPTQTLLVICPETCRLCNQNFECMCKCIRHIFSDEHLESLIRHKIEVRLGDMNSWMLLINEALRLSGLAQKSLPAVIVNPLNGEYIYV